ncbi:MAG: CHAT domain-containing protein, partial [Bacteroidota bacterium]
KLLLPIAQIHALPPQLLVVPDGVLGYLPFDALLTEQVRAQNYGQYYHYPYLLRQHQLSYTYSATLLQRMNTMVIAPEHQSVLAFAPSFGHGFATASERGSIFDERMGLSPLLHNQRETAAIHQLLGGKNIYGTTATKQRFLDLARQYSYLHLSSHARMNDEQSDYSYIAFTQHSNTTLDKAQLLFVRELYNTPLQAEMVVLSACETALGKLHKGEGIMSLARAFSYAGTRSVITTLWRVNDQATADLMISFYAHLQAGKSKDEALWLAKKALLTEGVQPHPYYWAGFVPIGNMQALDSNSTLNYWRCYMFGLVGLIGLCFVIWRFFR